MTAQVLNQFAQTPVLGDLDLEISTGAGSVFSAIVNTSQATPIVAGTALKWAATSYLGGPPQVLSANAGDQICGFATRNLKDASVSATNRLEVAGSDSALWLTANAAITRGQSVEAVVATPGLVQTALGILPIAGYALDTALNNGDLIRVVLTVPTGVGAANTEKNLLVTVTLAQINAGLVLIPGVAGKKLRVMAVTQRVLGNFASGTNVELESTNASPVAVVTTAEAGLTDGAFLFSGDTHNTIGAGFFADLGSGDGLKVINNGSAQTGGTSITYGIVYSLS